MSKYSFLDDYSEGCHPAILERMGQSNLSQQTAYGNDNYSERARELIRSHLADESTAVHFVTGGTLANIIILAAALRPHEAVIAADSGHIVVRETGAIEATGHKILTCHSDNGKINPDQVVALLAANSHFPHMAKPRLVYLSNASETGTIYTKAELEALHNVCRRHGLLLMMDGARLGVALTATNNDLTLADISQLCDVFWIGGTKAGALLGESIVIPNSDLAIDFDFHIKQRGALLAKGRVLGLQFETLFTDGLFFDLCSKANQLAMRLSQAMVGAGFKLAAPTESNQIFPILPNALIAELKAKFDFYEWEKRADEHSVVRLVTSWATPDVQVDAFIRSVDQITKHPDFAR